MGTPVLGRPPTRRSPNARRWRLIVALILVLLGLTAVRWVGELGSSPEVVPLSEREDPGRYDFYHPGDAAATELAWADDERPE